MTPEQVEQLNNDIKATFTEFDAGIRVYKWLEKLCFVNKQTRVIGQEDQSAFNDGMRDVIIEINERIRRATEPPPKPVNTINRE